MSPTAFEMSQFESPRGEKSTRESKQWLGCLLPQREKVRQKEGKSEREKERKMNRERKKEKDVNNEKNVNRETKRGE